MYEVVRNVIESKNYELKEMLTKIDTLWVQGSLTEEQRLELIQLARENAMVSNSVDVMEKLSELDRNVKALEERVKALEDAKSESADEESGETEEGTEETATYPEYEAGKWYRNGDMVSFDGKVYKCIAPEGIVCVWSPADYPAYWEEYVEAPEEVPEEIVEEDTEITE